MAINLFAGLKTAKANPDGNYLGAGNYWLRLDKNKADVTRKKIPFLAAEMTIIHVVAPFQDRKPHNIGEEVTQMFMSDSDYFASDLKKFLAGAFGVPVEAVGDEDGLVAWGKKLDEKGNMEDDVDATGQVKQPMRGMVLEYDNKLITGEKDAATGKIPEWTKYKVMREVPPEEVIKALSAINKERFFPNQYLENQVKNKAAQAAAPK